MKRRRADERGAVAVLTAGLMLGLVATAALAVDIGMQRVGRTDMQSLADVVALDLSRELDDRTVDEMEAIEDNLIAAALRRNDGSLGDSPDLGAEWGEVDELGEFGPVEDSDDPPTAVRVSASTDVDFAFGIASSGGATRSAISQRTEDTACFELGSFAAALDLGDSVLGPFADFLGLGTQLELVSYEQLAGADVSLLGIAAAPTIGSPTALLAPSGVSVGTLIGATIYALEHNKDAGSTQNNAAIAVLNGLLQAESGLDLDQTVVIPDVVSVDAGDSAALSADLNVLEFIGPSLALANGDSFLDVQVPIDLGLLGEGNLTLSAIQGPRFACGRPWPTPSDTCAVIKAGGGACARQSQVGLTFELDETNIPLGLDIIPLVSGGISATVGPVVLSGGVGNGKGVLSSVDSCGPPDQITVDAYSGLLGVDLSLPVSLGGTVSLNISGALPGPLGTLVDTVLSLPGLLSGILSDYEYQYRKFKLDVVIEDVSALLQAGTDGTTMSGAVPLESPTNDRSGEAVPFPDPAQPLALGDLSVPSSLLAGEVSVLISYEWRRRKTFLGLPVLGWTWLPGPPTGKGPQDGWVSSTTQSPPNSTAGPLFSGDLADLSELPAPLGQVGSLIDDGLSGVTSVINDEIVGTVNEALGSTLLPLLGLTGAGLDLYSVSRPLCGGPPRLVG